MTLHGIVLSRIRDGQIIEDWAVTDRVERLRQLGAWRSMLLVVNQLWSLLRGRSLTTKLRVCSASRPVSIARDIRG